MRETNTEKERTTVWLPVDAKERAKEDPDIEMSEACRQGLKCAVYGDDVVEAEALNDVTYDVLDELQSVNESFDCELEERSRNGMVTLDKVRALKDELLTPLVHELAVESRERESETTEEYAKDVSKRFEQTLSGLDDRLQNGEHVFPGYGKVEKAASLRGISPKEVVEKLKERNPGLSEYQFEKRSESQASGPSLRSVNGSSSVATDGGEPESCNEATDAETDIEDIDAR